MPLHTLENAPEADEPETPEEAAAVAAAWREKGGLRPISPVSGHPAYRGPNFSEDIMQRTKLVKLGFLLLLLAALISGRPRPVAAAPCCSLCEPRYEDCVAACDGDSHCEYACTVRLNTCEAQCIPGC